MLSSEVNILTALNQAILAYGQGPRKTLASAANAAVSKFGGTNQAASAKSQSTLDGAISKLQSITDSNTARSQQMADAANAFTAAQNDKAMAFSAAEAEKNRNWQKMMSDTAHQREVKDLMAAGLNPVLSAMGGNGAAVGSGATASSSSGSGQKGEVDHSLSQGFVSLLGTMLSAQTQLAQTAMSARSNEAIADKNNAMSQLIAQITGQYSLAREQVSGEYGLERQRISDAAALERSHVSGQYTLSGKRIDADAAMSRLQSSQAHDIYMAQNFPNNTLQAINALVGELLGSDSGITGAVNLGKRVSQDPLGTWVDGLPKFIQDYGRSFMDKWVDINPWTSKEHKQKVKAERSKAKK